MENIILSQHAAIRCQQRGIETTIIDKVLKYGRKVYQGDSSFIYFVPKKKAKKHGLSDEVVGIGVVYSNGIIITVKHIYKKIEKKFNCNQHRRRSI